MGVGRPNQPPQPNGASDAASAPLCTAGVTPGLLRGLEEDPEAFAIAHPLTIALELGRWLDRPGLLAHALVAAAEHAPLAHGVLLAEQLDGQFSRHPQPYVREAVLLAWHTLADRAPADFRQRAQAAMRAATHDELEAVRNTAEQLLATLAATSPGAPRFPTPRATAFSIARAATPR